MSANNQRIIDWVDGRFAGVAPTDQAQEQKEELQTHMEDIVKEYMAEGMDFSEAFATAKDDMGDLDELLSGEGFKMKKKKKATAEAAIDHVYDNRSNDPFGERSEACINEFEEYGHRSDDRGWRFRINHEGVVALSPFIYLFMGLTFGWWAWGWMIIPVSAIVFCAGDRTNHKIVGLSPFIYLALGATLGWWAWGWIVIPLSAIIFEGGIIRINHRD